MEIWRLLFNPVKKHKSKPKPPWWNKDIDKIKKISKIILKMQENLTLKSYGMNTDQI